MATNMDKARSYTVLDHPFFANILLRHPMIETREVETLSVAYTGQIKYNPDFFETLPIKQAVFVLAHEVLHYASRHHLRQGSRNFEDWNHACDAWVNETLANTGMPTSSGTTRGIGEVPPDCVRWPGAEKLTPETIYDIIQQQKQQGGKPPPGKGDGESKEPALDGSGKAPGQPPPPGPGKGQNGPGQDPLGNDVEPPPPLTDGEKKEQEAQTKLEVAEAAQSAKMRGKLPGLLQKMVADLVESKVPWFDILERYMTEKVAQDVSWARPNRRYMPDFYLPTRQSLGSMGELVEIIDVSGSVSKQEIAHYNGHQSRIVELCNPLKTHVLYTDTRVLKHVEFEAGEEVAITYHSGGGTRMEAAFEYMAEHGISPACVIVLTDGYDSYDEKNAPDCPVIWCVSTDQVPPYGEVIPFNMNDTKE